MADSLQTSAAPIQTLPLLPTTETLIMNSLPPMPFCILDSQFTVTGSSIVADWQVNSGNCFTNPDSCANDDITADVKRRLFSGFTDNMAGFSDAQKALFGGMYVSTNAQYVQRIPDTTKPGDGSSSWSIKLANPHKDIAGNTTFGEMTAFVPSVYFQTQAGISGETAASQGMVVQAITTVWKPDATGQWKPNDIYTPVTSGSKAMNGGVYTRVTRLGYSAPKVVFNTKTGFLAGSDVPNYVPPDPPIMTGLSQASGIVTISYKPPYFDGNSPITSFKGYCEQNKIMYSNTIEQGYSRAVAVAGMQEGRVYCWVKARNAGGESLESETVSIDVGGVPPVFTEPAKGTSSVWMPPGQSTAAAASSTKTAAATTSSAAATTTSAAPAPVATSTKLAATTSPSTSGASDGIVSKFAVCLLGALMAVIGMAL